jgi:hypothetical protein
MPSVVFSSLCPRAWLAASMPATRRSSLAKVAGEVHVEAGSDSCGDESDALEHPVPPAMHVLVGGLLVWVSADFAQLLAFGTASCEQLAGWVEKPVVSLGWASDVREVGL